MVAVQEFTDPQVRSPFQPWVEDLDARIAANVGIILTRTERRDVSDVKGMGGGGGHLVILLGGGTQKRQNR
jgi:hypothetical protein